MSKKKEALGYFVNYLLKSKIKDDIAKVVLFGSLVRGKPKDDSDVDVLILGTENLDEISNVCADARMETYFNYSESIEPLVYPLERLRILNSYFLYRAINHGEEVYSMSEEDLKKNEMRNYLKLAEEYLEGASLNFDSGKLRIAADAAYNAAELCAKSLLLLVMDEIPSTHGSIIGEFSKLYVKTDKVSRQLGRRLNRALELRNKARYEFNADISGEKVRELIDLARVMKDLLAGKLE